MFYFQSFPTVSYDVTGLNAPQISIDITKGVRITEALRESALVYYDYVIKDRDRPDIMAEKYYENSRLDWIFFITNSIVDPYFSWPLNYDQFTSYLRQKYGSVEYANATTHSYEQIITPRKEFFSNYDSQTITIPERTVVVDQTTYELLPIAERKLITIFDYEDRLNNNKRNIRILDRSYVPGLLRTMRRIFDE